MEKINFDGIFEIDESIECFEMNIDNDGDNDEMVNGSFIKLYIQKLLLEEIYHQSSDVVYIPISFDFMTTSSMDSLIKDSLRNEFREYKVLISNSNVLTNFNLFEGYVSSYDENGSYILKIGSIDEMGIYLDQSLSFFDNKLILLKNKIKINHYFKDDILYFGYILPKSKYIITDKSDHMFNKYISIKRNEKINDILNDRS